MNKWWVRFWGFVALAALGALIATSARPASMPPGTPVPRGGRMVSDRPITPNAEIALSAAMAFFRTPDEGFIERRLAAAHASLTEAARADPEALRAADVLLLRGFNSLEVERLLSRHRLDYMSCETKTPVSDGTVMTMMTFFGGPIPRLPLSIAELVEMDIGRARHNFLWRAQQSADPEDSARLREMGLSQEIGVYRVEIVGTQRDLRNLIAEADVRGVVAEADGARARSFAKVLSEMPKELPPVIRTRMPRDGSVPLPPPPGMPQVVPR